MHAFEKERELKQEIYELNRAIIGKTQELIDVGVKQYVDALIQLKNENALSDKVIRTYLRDAVTSSINAYSQKELER